MTAAELKASILDRAVRGLLVPQDPSDEPAAKSSTVENPPYDLPRGWVWVRLGDLVNYGNCQNAESSDIPPDAWVLDLEEIEKDTGRLLVRAYAKDKKSKSTKHVFYRGMVLYSKLRTYLNKVLVADQDGFCTSEIIPLPFPSYIVPEFARRVLMSPMFLSYAESKGYGQKMPRFGSSDAKKAPFPLPPLAEQKRIVAKIEELMPLVEEYGKAEAELTALNENFPTALRKSILQHAVEGKLLPKATAWKEVKIKDIAKMYGGFAFKSTDYKKRGIQVVRISDLDEAGVSTKDPVFYDESQDLERYLIPHNAILVCLTGSIGKMTWIKDNNKRYLNQRIGMLIFNDERIIPYAWIFLHTPAVINSWITAKTSTNGNIKNSDVTDLPIPLPPLAEQKAIVARVEELLSLVDELKA